MSVKINSATSLAIAAALSSALATIGQGKVLRRRPERPE